MNKNPPKLFLAIILRTTLSLSVVDWLCLYNVGWRSEKRWGGQRPGRPATPLSGPSYGCAEPSHPPQASRLQSKAGKGFSQFFFLHLSTATAILLGSFYLILHWSLHFWQYSSKNKNKIKKNLRRLRKALVQHKLGTSDSSDTVYKSSLTLLSGPFKKFHITEWGVSSTKN